MISYPKVYIILVNYNGQQNTIECLESVLKLDYDRFTVIVVDNSSDNSFEMFREWSRRGADIRTDFGDLVLPYVSKPLDCEFIFEHMERGAGDFKKQLLFIRAKENKGFAAGNNLALSFIRESDYNYVWLLNNDTVVERNSLAALIKSAEKSAGNVGMWGAKLMMYHQPDRIQGVGGHYNKWLGVVKEIGFNQVDAGQWDSPNFSFNYVIGASMFVSREFIEDVGLMEEDYFLYYEELDWAIRGEQRGWTLGFCPKCKIYHKMGASINEKRLATGNSLLSDFYAVRNRILLTKKFFPYALLTLYPAFLMFIVNRIRYWQLSRIIMLFKVIINPKKHFKES